MSVLFIMPGKSPGLVIVSNDSALLALIPYEAARAAGLYLYLAPYLGARTATDYLDETRVIDLSFRDWQRAVPTTVEQVVAAIRHRKQRTAYALLPVEDEGRGHLGGAP